MVSRLGHPVRVRRVGGSGGGGDEAGRRLPATTVVPDPTGLGVVTVPVPADGIVMHVWAVSLTADGVPSRLVGPLNAATLGPGA